MDKRQSDRILSTVIDDLQRSDLKLDERFFSRLGAQFSTIAELLERLYGKSVEFDSAVTQMLWRLARSYEARPERMRLLDLQREQHPAWLQDSRHAAYMAYLDRFAGDLAGLEKRIPYLRELGITIVHLMPFLKGPAGQSDGGYAVSNYREVEPAFGTMDDLRRVAEGLHDEGMLLEVDLVVNHTSDEHDWAVRARAGEKQHQEYFYMFDDRTIPDQFEQSMPEVFPDTSPGNFTYVSELDKWVMTVFNDFQWDLNYSNCDVLVDMTEILFFLANCGADIIRLDAVPFLWKRIGTNCQNQEEAHLILRIFHACARVVAPGIAFVAEAIVAPMEIVKYFGEGEYTGRECDTAYHATMMVLLWDALATGNTRAFHQGLSSIPEIPPYTSWFTYIRCHDDIGLGYDDADLHAVGYDPSLHRAFMVAYYTGRFAGSVSRGAPFMANPKTGDARISGTSASLVGLEYAIEQGDDEEITKAINKLVLLYSICFSIGGIPIVYYGDELATLNDMSYLEDGAKQDDNRWMHRPVFDWAAAERRNRPDTVEGRVFSRLQRLLKLRGSLPEFGSETPASMIDLANESVLAYERRGGEKGSIVVAANISDRSQAVRLNGAYPDVHAWLDIVSCEAPQQFDDMLIMPAHGFYWLRPSHAEVECCEDY